MVSVELIGGLGNQMFQIAACIAYAKKHDLEYHIPLKTQNSHRAEPYFLDLQNKSWDESKEKIYYDEPAFHYTEIPHIHIDPAKQNFVLRGYFQSYKYFEGLNLGQLFYNSLLTGSTKPRWLPSSNINSLAIHIRKGDYDLYPTKHPVVSVDYISAAIDTLFDLNRKKIQKIAFFSDSPDWCAQFAHLRKLSCSVVFEYDPVKAFLELMSYDHFVLSNSTFGYWAAIMNCWLWFNGNPLEKVVYPKKWFGPDYAHMNTDDLCPTNWIKM